MKSGRENIFAATVLALAMSAPASAEDLKSFTEAIDSRFTMQYIDCKTSGKKTDAVCIAVYKVLDIQKVPDMQTQLLTDDKVEFAFPCDRKKQQINVASPLPWAELKDDGIVSVHMPNKYLKKLSTTSGATVWQIDNKDNQFKLVKQKNKKWWQQPTKYAR